MRFGLVTGLLLLSCCHRPPAADPPEIRAAKEAFARYRIIAADGSHQERCLAAIDVRRAWLNAIDAQRYRAAKRLAESECALADADRQAVVDGVQNEAASTLKRAHDQAEVEKFETFLLGQIAAGQEENTIQVSAGNSDAINYELANKIARDAN